ncbi:MULTISPECIES: hypothetical protein [Bradyrhizobium]|uniref:hypothetical protein n=1 Tax=Bradyrhizobium elkanii TaxID=29448 RepID=UPI000402DBD8|nr:hypothetical protein [Bradyrhizobium elkanii]
MAPMLGPFFPQSFLPDQRFQISISAASGVIFTQVPLSCIHKPALDRELKPGAVSGRLGLVLKKKRVVDFLDVNAVGLFRSTTRTRFTSRRAAFSGPA